MKMLASLCLPDGRIARVIGTVVNNRALAVQSASPRCYYRRFSFVFAALLVFGAWSETSSADETLPVARRKFRLVSVDVPHDSPHRLNEAINHPPTLYVRIKKNGVPFAGKPYSSEVKGWSVTFPFNEEANYWPIRVGTTDRYDIEIWDSNWGSDDLILTISNVPGVNFKNEIFENGSKHMSKDLLVKLYFEDQGDWPEEK